MKTVKRDEGRTHATAQAVRRALPSIARVLAVSTLLGSSFVQPAWAQVEDEPETGADSPKASSSHPVRVIEEIVVTAQKREQSLQEVPISLSVVDSEFVKDASITDFRDLSLYVPNVSVNNTSGQFNDVRIRGFGSPQSVKAFEQPVGLVIDGVPYNRLQYWQGPVYDLDRVEVLRGPQGTIFGKNTTAGLFNVVTKRPTTERTGYIRGELGELEHRRFEAALGGPLIRDLLNFRISGLSDERDGILGNTTAAVVPGANDRMNGRDRKALRAQLGAPDLAGLALNVRYETVELELTGAGSEIRLVVPNQIPFYREYDPDVDLVKGNWIGSIDQPDFRRATMHLVVADAAYDLAGWGLNALVGYSLLDEANQEDNDFNPSPVISAFDASDNPQTVVELRTDSPSFAGLLGLERLFGFELGRSDFLAGFFFQHRGFDNRIDLTIDFPILAQFLATDATGVVPPCPACGTGTGVETFRIGYDETSLAFAGFSHLRWYLADRWTLESGMRFTQEQKDGSWETAITEGSGVGMTAVLQAEEFTRRQTRSESAFTPNVTLAYDWSDDVRFYAGWVKGFKGGGLNSNVFNDNAPEGLSYEPEIATSWEVGTKMSLFDRTATLNLGLYRQDVEDLQVFTLTPDLQILVENAGEARSQGVEVDSSWLPTSWLTLRGSLAFTDANFIDYPIGSCAFDKPNTDGDEDDRCDLSGQPLEFSPKWSSMVTPSVRVPLTTLPGLGDVSPISLGGVDFFAALAVEFRDVHFAQITLDPRSRQPSFFRVGANIGFGDPGRGWSLRLIGENLTNELVAAHIRDMTIVGRSFVHFPEPPRLFFGEFRWEF